MKIKREYVLRRIGKAIERAYKLPNDTKAARWLAAWKKMDRRLFYSVKGYAA